MAAREDLPEGYEIPIHRSLVVPRLWMGVPRKMFITELLLGVTGGIFLKTWTVLFVVIGLHYLNRHLTKKDPLYLQVFLRAIRHKKFYYKG